MRAAGIVICLFLLTACVRGGQRPTALSGDGDPRPSTTAQRDAPPTEPRPLVVVAYVPYWDQERAFATVTANAAVLTDVSPWWYSVWPDGSVGPQWQDAGHIDLAVVRRLQALGLRVVPTVSNHRDGEWEAGPVRRVLREPAVQDVHVSSIVDIVTSGGFDGIDIDYEDLSAADRDQFTALVERLVGELRPLGKIVTVDLHPKTDDAGDNPRNEAQDFAALGASADQLRLMSYDLHNDETGPGPIAPTDWLDEVLRYLLSVAPAERVVLGIPLFGYDWLGDQADGLTWEEVTARAAEDADSLETIPHEDESMFRYKAGKRTREVWYFDGEDVLARIELARERGLGGVFFWRLGGEDPALWEGLAR